jgi:NADPH-dependent 2,4-dienoyl-CoA reductase/sulfur reductase-like enzyme
MTIIIGGGPAGMAAALAASKEGAKVLLIDRNHYLGGILNQCIHDGFGLIRFGKSFTGPEYANIFINQVTEDKNIEVMLDTMVTRITPDKRLYGISRSGIFCEEAGAVVFATGCRERTRGAIGIPGTRPAGIYTAGVVQYLINISNIAVGKKAVILGSGDVGLIMARRLVLSGVEVSCVLEKLPHCSGLPRNRYQCLEDYNIPLFLSRTVTRIYGNKRLEGVAVSNVDDKGLPVPGTEYEITCDTLVLSVGLIPENEIIRQLSITVQPETNSIVVNKSLETSVSGVFLCGNSLHVNDLVDNVSDEGETAGKWAGVHSFGLK